MHTIITINICARSGRPPGTLYSTVDLCKTVHTKTLAVNMYTHLSQTNGSILYSYPITYTHRYALEDVKTP